MTTNKNKLGTEYCHWNLEMFFLSTLNKQSNTRNDYTKLGWNLKPKKILNKKNIIYEMCSDAKYIWCILFVDNESNIPCTFFIYLGPFVYFCRFC